MDKTQQLLRLLLEHHCYLQARSEVTHQVLVELLRQSGCPDKTSHRELEKMVLEAHLQARDELNRRLREILGDESGTPPRS